MSDEAVEHEVQEATESLQNLEVKSDAGDSGDQQLKKTEKLKVDILLKPTGNAPIMKKKKWLVDVDKRLSWVIEFIRRYMKLDPQEKLFLYINQTFAPAPDQTIKNLYDCYNTDGQLVLHYCKTQAWG